MVLCQASGILLLLTRGGRWPKVEVGHALLNVSEDSMTSPLGSELDAWVLEIIYELVAARHGVIDCRERVFISL